MKEKPCKVASPWLSGDHFAKNLLPEYYRICRQEIRRKQSCEQHDETELLLVEEGSGILNVNGCDYPLRRGSCFLLYLYHIHRITPSPGCRLKTCSIHMPYATYLFLSTAPCCSFAGIDEEYLLHTDFSDSVFRRSCELMERMEQNRSEDPMIRLKSLGYIAEILGQLFKSAPHPFS